MRPTRSLRSAFTWWFAGTLVVLYGVVATGVWLHARAGDQHSAILTLKAEGEAVAAYLASTGRIDAPEFAAPEATPFPIWFRLRQGARILAQTPGAPDLPLRRPRPSKDEILTEWSPPIKGPYLTVYHTIGGPLQGSTLEVIAPTASLLAAQHKLAAALAIVGLVVIPLAALGGRFLAQWALRSMDRLVTGIRALDSGRLSDRLELPDGAVAEVAVLARAFNQLLDTLESSVDTMRRFTADASHEIRNPLSVLRTGLEVALRRPRKAEEYRILIQENLQEIQRLQAVLEGLLALAREVPGAPYVRPKTAVNLSRLLEQTSDTFSTVAAERGIRIEEDIAPDLSVEGDAQLLRLAAFNLIDNALKHSPTDETVVVTLAACGAEVELVVADHGPGVAPENRERIFRRNARAERTAAPGVSGLGLGVVSWVTERHGGRVQLLDTARGAAFRITLPGLSYRGPVTDAPAATRR